MDPISIGGQLTKVIAKYYNIFSQISEDECAKDPMLHDLRTEALRLREWKQGWNSNLDCPHPTTTPEGQRNLDPNDAHYHYAVTSLMRIVAGFATVAELQSNYTKQVARLGKSSKRDIKSQGKNTLAPITGRITRSRSKSLCTPKTTPASESHSTSDSALTQHKLRELGFWENPKSLENSQSTGTCLLQRSHSKCAASFAGKSKTSLGSDR